MPLNALLAALPGLLCASTAAATAFASPAPAPTAPAAAVPAPTAPAAAAPAAAPQIPRDGWKDCLYNEAVIRCLDQQAPDQLRIIWIDGVRSSFSRRPPLRPGLPSYWGDRHGGLWRRDLLPQGNTLLTHLGNGNRILVPLRHPCRPPLQGEVGYCH